MSRLDEIRARDGADTALYGQLDALVFQDRRHLLSLINEMRAELLAITEYQYIDVCAIKDMAHHALAKLGSEEK